MADNLDTPRGAVGFGCLVVIGVIGFIVVRDFREDDARQKVPFDDRHAVTVSAPTLFADFDDNEIAARSKYAGSINLTGIVDQIESGAPATISLSVEHAGDPYKVKALVPDEKKAIPLRVGDVASFHCVGARKSFDDVVVDACNWLVKAPPVP